MARTTRKIDFGKIYFPKDMSRGSWKVEIITTSGVTYDVTNYLIDIPNLNRVATVGVSSFSLNLDNGEGRYKDIFATKNAVNIYYDFLIFSSLITIKFRGYIDSVFDSFDYSTGWTLIIEGRDVPISSTNEHFADTHITASFSGRNTLDCWLGTEGIQDSNGNYEDGILYNSGLILKVYDSVTFSWKIYKDLTIDQQEVLKSQTGYTFTISETYVEKSRLTISSDIANKSDYEFRLEYNQEEDNTYLMVHPEESIINEAEAVIVAQNLIRLPQFGADKTTEYNRIREKGEGDSGLFLMRTKSDTDSQESTWIKDKEETTSSIISDIELSAKGVARLNELKTAPKTGTIETCMLPSLQPGEMIPISIPYIFTGNVKVKSFTISINTDITFNLSLQDKETTFSKLFKDRIDENVNVTPTNNPNNMKNSVVFDFITASEYTLSDCEITNDGVLRLSSGKTTGTCIFPKISPDSEVSKSEIRIKANQYSNCTYELSNDNGSTFEPVAFTKLYNYFNPNILGIILKITLNVSPTGSSPEFDKVSVMFDC
jgi:hypothetical protein